MPEPFAMDAGVQYAFAPSPELVEGVLHRIHVVFESSDGRGWSAGTDLMSPTAGSAADFCDGMNARLGLGREEWMALAERVFAERARPSDDPGDAPFEFP